MRSSYQRGQYLARTQTESAGEEMGSRYQQRRDMMSRGMSVGAANVPASASFHNRPVSSQGRDSPNS
jgi:hypothetical protein